MDISGSELGQLIISQLLLLFLRQYRLGAYLAIDVPLELEKIEQLVLRVAWSLKKARL
ncbi:hypothetical protein HU830_08080 [Lactobacillus sp. DCY120]|uniref:Uncharacterized protein n=1 Tax=Bombilactobacillus apium TaxID=2675299 RepID=A0A850R897_9LACO|nr:hypothetical protein [Bombilactobacillus apium]NVY97077.1 hypothetical protein [Bombilactobacillus apium]